MCLFRQPCRLADPLLKGSHEEPSGQSICSCTKWLQISFVAVKALHLRFMISGMGSCPDVMGDFSLENFSGLQSGSSYQICSLPRPVQHLPYQVVLYFQHSHYSPVCPGVKLVRHLPDAFCPLQWQLTGQPAGHLVCEYSFTSCIHLYKGTVEMWGWRDNLWFLRHTLISGHTHWNSNLFELMVAYEACCEECKCVCCCSSNDAKWHKGDTNFSETWLNG